MGVNQATAQYCLPTYNNPCTTDDFINSVTFNTIFNGSTGCTSPGANNYEDYTGTISTTVTQGSTYTLTAASGTTWDQYIVAFIDWNQDLDFDDPGEFYDVGYSNPAGTSVSVNITVPFCIPMDSTRLRVMCRYSGAALTQADVCATGLSFGETEDYSIVVVPGPPSTNAAVLSASQPVDGCGLSTTEPVTVSILNAGSDTLTALSICYAVDTLLAVCESWTGTLLPCDTLVYSFTGTADLSVTGLHTFEFNVTASGDTLNINDSLFNYIVNSGQVITSPVVVDFDTLTDGETGVLTNGWVGSPVAGYRWEANTLGTGSTGTGPNADNTSGTGIYMYTEASGAAIGAVAELESPCIDLSGLIAPQFDFWYHKFGTTVMGDLYIDIFSGGVWTTDVDSVIGTTQFSNADAWLLKTVDLTLWAGQTVTIRFRAISNGSFQGDMAIDDINIREKAANDVSLFQATAPNSACGLSATEQVTVSIVNLGLDTAFTFNISYDFTGTPVTEAFNDTLLPNDTLTYTFATAADLSVSGTYVFNFYVALVGDSLNGNDSLFAYTVINTAILTSPFSQSFDTLVDGETGTLSNGWIGTPAAGYRWEANTLGTGSSGTGPSADHTTGTGIYMYTEASGAPVGGVATLESPCFDLDTLVNPTLEFWYHKFGTVVMGDLFVDVFAGGSWDMNVDSILGTTQNADTDPWLQRFTDLSAYSGQVIKLRFRGVSNGSFQGDMAIDDVSIMDQLVPPATVDLGPDVTVCDSVILDAGIHTTYNWSTGDTTQTIVVNTTGTYSVTVADSGSLFTATDVVEVAIAPSYAINNPDIDICQGDSIMIFGTLQSVAGTYVDSFLTVCGNDSIFTQNLIVNSNFSITNPDVTICQGDSVMLGGSLQTTAGTYIDSLATVNGCDSVVTTTLIVTPTITISETASICPGDTFSFPDGTTSDSALVHTSNFTAMSGCDSLIVTTLTMLPTYNIAEAASVCPGSTYTFPDSTTSDSATVHTSNLTTVVGCDSIVVTTLTMAPTFNITASASVCAGDTYTFPDGATSDSATTHTSNLSSVVGCDSIVVTTLTVTPAINVVLTANICEGDSLLIGGAYQTTAGTYTDSLVSAAGCDSIVATTLSIDLLPVITITGVDTLCAASSAVTLVASPSGGTFSGTGVTGNSFDPTVAGAGTHTITYSFTDSALCTGQGTTDINVEVCPGITEENTAQNISIYPNPNNGSFFVELNGTNNELVTVEVRNLLGQLVSTYQLPGDVKKAINLGQVPHGVYMVRVIGKSGIGVKRLVIQ